MNSTGPLFIVGMPRSGTKLLRDLLNQHSGISIPEVETHFLPLFIKKYGKVFPVDEQKENLLEDFEKTAFFWNNMQLNNFNREVFDHEKKSVNSWDAFAFLVFRHFGPNKTGEGIIYGDKTPGYVKHLHLLKEMFPEAKFIHIIRDPRDFCISVKNIWNKSMFRAAATWNTTLAKSATFSADFASDYLEIRYEDLISDIDETMNKVSAFLQIPFEHEMTKLSKSAENYGAAKGETKILQNNKEKYLDKLSRREIRKIEEITFKQLSRLKYRILYAGEQSKIGGFEMMMLKLYDAYNSLAFHVREKGLKNGLTYFLRLHKESSWR